MKPPRSLKSRALQLLAQRDQSRVELRRKLLAHARAARAEATGSSGGTHADDDEAADPAARAAEVDAVLDWLEANRFLSAERFAESRVNARLARFGNLRIRGELARHAVALSPDAERALNETELARARSVRARKFPMGAGTPSEQARQARFLGARGFSSDVVRRVLREAPAADDIDP